MKHTKMPQHIIKIETMCSCDNIVQLEYSRLTKRWETMCPICKLNNWAEIITPILKFKSNDYLKLKTCENCGETWMRLHTCKAPDILAIQKTFRNIKGEKI